MYDVRNTIRPGQTDAWLEEVVWNKFQPTGHTISTWRIPNWDSEWTTLQQVPRREA